METMVIAVIVLAVLVVLLLIFTGVIGGSTKGVQNCNNRGGECSQNECSNGAALAKMPDGKGDSMGCSTNQIYCCSRVQT